MNLYNQGMTLVEFKFDFLSKLVDKGQLSFILFQVLYTFADYYLVFEDSFDQ